MSPRRAVGSLTSANCALQIVEVHEEYAPVDGTEPLCREDKSPTRKEKQAIDDLKTSGWSLPWSPS